MHVTCNKCGEYYNDENRWTLCPHGPLHGPNKYCRKHDLDPCPICDPSQTNPLYQPSRANNAKRVEHLDPHYITDRWGNSPALDKTLLAQWHRLKLTWRLWLAFAVWTGAIALWFIVGRLTRGIL